MTQKQKNVLIVEDEKPLARALQLKLEHDGLKVSWASTGTEGLALLKKELFDVVILDLVMPDFDGFHVLEIMRGRVKMPKVVVVSNLGQQTDVDRAMSLGAHQYFVKSNTPLEDIIAAVKAI